ncbi:CPBP family intramembrane glutamic endopeptidase [Bacillus thuringiensis]|uniref:CPBP family intramembrane glutamic endopeptidase n=1 Tax=Bacillus thuringiensis TaxID=1428 RepID=UPI00333CB080
MKKSYIWVIATYIIMQFTNVIGAAFVFKSGLYGNTEHALILTKGNWSVVNMTIAVIVMFLLLRKEWSNKTIQYRKGQMPIWIWMIIGGLGAIVAQAIATLIEQKVFHVQVTSQNTQYIFSIIQAVPLYVVTSIVYAPIMEELVFRKVIYGTLAKKYNFFIAALLSSGLFALIHMEFTHFLVYLSMGLVFSFVYKMTDKILVPITAHMIMNAIVFLTLIK